MHVFCNHKQQQKSSNRHHHHDCNAIQRYDDGNGKIRKSRNLNSKLYG